jgi:hypothetical protein
LSTIRYGLVRGIITPFVERYVAAHVTARSGP